MASAVQTKTKIIPPQRKAKKTRPNLKVVKGPFPKHKIDVSLFLEEPADSKTAEKKRPEEKKDETREYILDLGERIHKSEEKRGNLTEGDIMSSLCG